MRLARAAVVFGVVAAMSLYLVPGAGASAPSRGTFDFTNSFTDTEVCAAPPWGFDVFVPIEHEYGFFEVFTDKDGNTVKILVHFNYDATLTANGKAIYERDTWTTFLYPDGQRTAGLTVHIQGPGGIVVRDAGQIVRDADGNLLYTRGPHEQLSGVSFCPPLAP